MKKRSHLLKILILFLTLFLLNACTNEKVATVNNASAINSEENSLNIENQILSLCEIGKNPTEFDGQTVRLKVRIEFGTENAVISDENCKLYKSVVAFESKDSYAPIEKAEKALGKKEAFNQAHIEIEAKFINKPHTECCTRTSFQFKVTKTLDFKPIIRK